MYQAEIKVDTDGRWPAEVPGLPGMLAFGAMRDAAVRKASSLSLRGLTDRLEDGPALYRRVPRRRPMRPHPDADRIGRSLTTSAGGVI